MCILFLANVGPKVHILFQIIFRPNFVSFWGETRGKGSKNKDDKVWHGVRGVKNIDFLSDILFEWLNELIKKLFEFFKTLKDYDSSYFFTSPQDYLAISTDGEPFEGVSEHGSTIFDLVGAPHNPTQCKVRLLCYSNKTILYCYAIRLDQPNLDCKHTPTYYHTDSVNIF